MTYPVTADPNAYWVKNAQPIIYHAKGWTVRDISIEVRMPLREIISGEGSPGDRIMSYRGTPALDQRYPFRFTATTGTDETPFTGISEMAYARVIPAPAVGPYNDPSNPLRKVVNIQIGTYRITGGQPSFLSAIATFYWDDEKREWQLHDGDQGDRRNWTWTCTGELVWLR